MENSSVQVSGDSDKENTQHSSPKRKPPTHLCMKCGELGHLTKKCVVQFLSDADRI